MGEIIIDLTEVGKSTGGNVLFERNLGGAPLNVAVAVARLGLESAVVSKVGNDTFGKFAVNELKTKGVHTEGICFSNQYKTALSLVHLDETGDRSFEFYRNPSADMTISDDDIDYSLIGQSKAFHFGSISMTNEPARGATLKAVEYAKSKGLTISFDPNLRPSLWGNLNDAKKQMCKGVSLCDVLKVSVEEMEFLTGEKSLEKGSEVLLKQGAKAVFVTLGKDGCFYRVGSIYGKLPTYDTKVVDTTGCGDAFMGAILYEICKSQIDIACSDNKEIEKIVMFANATGSLAAEKRGGLASMPDLESVERLMKTTSLLR